VRIQPSEKSEKEDRSAALSASYFICFC